MPTMTDRLKKGEVWGLLILLLVHVFVLPLGVFVYVLLSGGAPALSDAWINFVYYAISLTLVLLVGGRYLRRSFDNLLDKPLNSLKSFLIGWGVYWALNLILTAIMIFIPFFRNANPNQSAIADIVMQDSGPIIAVTVFMAPIVEEVIFRGGLFCGLYHRNRILAYVVSVVVFSLYHVWQFALLGDVKMLLFAVQYIPAAVALCWCYEKSDSLWTCIFFHMSINALGIFLM